MGQTRRLLRFLPNDRISCLHTDGVSLVVGSANGGVFYWPHIFASLVYQTPALCCHSPESTVAVYVSGTKAAALIGDLYMQTWDQVDPQQKHSAARTHVVFPRIHTSDACASSQTLSCGASAFTITRNSTRIIVSDFDKKLFRTLELDELVPFQGILCHASEKYIVIKCIVIGSTGPGRHPFRMKIYERETMSLLHTFNVAGCSCVEVFDEVTVTDPKSDPKSGSEPERVLVCVEDETETLLAYSARSAQLLYSVSCGAPVISIVVIEPNEASSFPTANLVVLLGDSSLMLIRGGSVLTRTTLTPDPLIHAELSMARLYYFAVDPRPLLLLTTGSEVYEIVDWAKYLVRG